VVQPSEGDAETRGGLIIPASAETPCRSGIVTAVGPDVSGIEPGDKVLYPREAGYDIRMAGSSVRVIKRDELIARVHD
jgi:co-chaperonin GroES (HSP10)